MQDLVFPVLAFVGGAGELAYWAILKEAFHHIGLKMPIFVPRMSMTIISRRTEKRLRETNLSVEAVMAGQAAEQKTKLVDELQDHRFTETVDVLQQKLKADYEMLYEWFDESDVMMNQLLQKNLAYHEKQFDYLKQKYEDAVYVKHDAAFRKFDCLEAALYPEKQLQERIYHPYVYLNEYGPKLIKELLTQPFDEDGAHYLVFL